MGSALNLQAQTFDFENTKADSTLFGQDNWEQHGQAAVNKQFMIRTVNNNKLLQVKTGGTSGLRHAIDTALGDVIDLQWRWRALEDSIEYCLGLGTANILGTSVNSRSVVCFNNDAISSHGSNIDAIKPPFTYLGHGWIYMRVKANIASHQFSVYMDTLANRSTEKLLIENKAFVTIEPINQLIIRTNNGKGMVEVDDIQVGSIVWTTWTGMGADNNWNTPSNWSAGKIPGPNDNVVFEGSANKKCMLNGPTSIRNILFTAGNTSALDLNTQVLSITGSANFAGAIFPGNNGILRFSSSQDQLIVSIGHPSANPPAAFTKTHPSIVLPPIEHTGTGSLKITNRGLLTSSFIQTAGSLDLQGFFFTAQGDFIVQQGDEKSILNIQIANRITNFVAVKAVLEGREGHYLQLSSEGVWNLNISTGSAEVRFAVLKNNTVQGLAKAYQSIDSGGNTGWSFDHSPNIVTQPDSQNILVGQKATFKIGVKSDSVFTYQWFRDNALIAGATDSIYILPITRYADSGSTFYCQINYGSAKLKSKTVPLNIVFPTPTASPPGSSNFSRTLSIKLTSPLVAIDSIWYKWKSKPGFYKYKDSLVLANSDTLIAYSFKNGEAGPSQKWEFLKFTPGQLITLNPGTTYLAPGNYKVTHNNPQGEPAQIEILSPDSLKNIKGFKDLSFVFRVTAQNTLTFNSINLIQPPNDSRDIYRLSSLGYVYYQTSNDTASLREGGIYFVAVDTLTPVITLMEETFGDQDSTHLSFSIQDNVINLLLDLQRSDDSSRNLKKIPLPAQSNFLPAQSNFSVNLKNPPGNYKPLWIELKVSDQKLWGFFPAALSENYITSQRLNELQTPPQTWNLGQNTDVPWDLVSLPFSTAPAITVKSLKTLFNTDLVAWSEWNIKQNIYPVLTETDRFENQKAYWLATSAPVTKASFGKVLIPTPKHSFTLHPGWNQIGNPGLTTLYWPISRTNMNSYANARVKGLHAYHLGSYDFSDSLVAWRGYLVYSNALQDTVINLLPHPLAKIVAKKSMAPVIPLHLSFASVLPIELGAADFGHDQFAIEDEMLLASPRGNAVWISREGHALNTDWLNYKPDQLHHWTLLIDGRKQNQALEIPVVEFQLPENFVAAAVSHKRNTKLALEKNSTLLSVPGQLDTLDIYAGPASLIENKLQNIASTPSALAWQLISKGQTWEMHLKIAANSEIQWTIWALNGKQIYRSSLQNFSPGEYILPLTLAEGQKMNSGLGLLNLSIRKGTVTETLQGKVWINP